MTPKHLIGFHTAGGLITGEACFCRVCQHPAVPWATWYDEALRLIGWYDAEPYLCGRCGRYYSDTGFYCPRCTWELDSAEEAWREHERLRREARARIDRWLAG